MNWAKAPLFPDTSLNPPAKAGGNSNRSIQWDNKNVIKPEKFTL